MIIKKPKTLALRWLPIIGLIAAFGSMIWLRFSLVNNAISTYTDCGNECSNWIVPAYDVGVLALILMLIGAAYISSRWLKFLLASLGILVLLAYGVDLFVFFMLHHRLNFADILSFSGEM